MGDKTKIEWTRGDDGSPGATWNPVTGCVEVSPGCDRCYAKTFAERWRGVPGHPYENGFDVTLRPERLDQPLRWRRPRRIFVNSMSDLFHEAIPDDYIARVFAVMAACPQHTFQVLTKRHGRMRSLLTSPQWPELLTESPEWPAAFRNGQPLGIDIDPERPLDNVWLGVSVEDQKWADIRIPSLLRTPAAVRFLSCEPLLGPVDLTRWLHGGFGSAGDHGDLHWVIAGGESGHGARPMDPSWPRSLRDDCAAAGVPFLFKQWGGRTSKAGGRELDGRTWDEYPKEHHAAAT